MRRIAPIRSAHDAATLLAHPLRPQILALAQHPISASDLARNLAVPRQRLNYHVQQLAAAGFLKRTGQQRKGNMVEQQYVATARCYVLVPELLAEVAPGPAGSEESSSAGHLLALCARAQADVAAIVESADAAGVRVRTLAQLNDVRFESAAQRARFSSALLEAVANVIAEHAAAAGTPNANATSAPFRVLVASYPVL